MSADRLLNQWICPVHLCTFDALSAQIDAAAHTTAQSFGLEVPGMFESSLEASVNGILQA